MWRYLLHSVWNVAGGASVLPAGVTERGKASWETGVDLGPSLSFFCCFLFFCFLNPPRIWKKLKRQNKKTKQKTKKRNTNNTPRGQECRFVWTENGSGSVAWSWCICVCLSVYVCVSLAPFASTGRGCSWRMFSSAPLVHFSPPQSAARASPSPSPRHDN